MEDNLYYYDYDESYDLDNNATGVWCNYTDNKQQVTCDGNIYYANVHEIVEASQYYKPGEPLFFVYLGCYIAATLFAGMMSGLTIGLLSLDITSLEVLSRSGHPSEKKYANRIGRVVKHHHWLLVTLLLSNAAAVETMPIFLNQIANEIVAIIISITLVLMFGEVIPQALCSRYGLSIGYYLSPIVVVLMILSFPISYPIALFLDCVIGHHGSGMYYRRSELRELVKLHGRLSDDNEDPLTIDEIRVVKGALELREKTVEDVMTPVDSAFMLDVNTELDIDILNEIYDQGYSRIPVYEGTRDNVIGVLLVKMLIRTDICEKKTIRSLIGSLLTPRFCLKVTPLYTALNQFFIVKTHLFFVHDTYPNRGKLIGLLTLEDILEAILNEEIVDETDMFIDVVRRIPVIRRAYQRKRQHSLISPVSNPRRSHPPRLTRAAMSLPAGDNSIQAVSDDENTPLLHN